jgi:hypothetical protein
MMVSLSQIMLIGAFLAGLAVSSVAHSTYDRLVDDPRIKREARVEGERAERQVWEEARRRAEIRNAQKLAEVQAKINAADRQLQDQRANERRRADAIRHAYEGRTTDGKIDPGPGCDCSQYALPDWVRKELE